MKSTTNKTNKTVNTTEDAKTKAIQADWRKSKFAVNYSPIIVSDNMTAKMFGFPSISTSVALNPICQARAKDKDSICSHCFAMSTVARYTALGRNLAHNTDVLTKEILPLESLPKFNRATVMCRFESFGDLNNATQVINYFNICKVNPHINFALWSKNPKLIALALESVEKPENITIIYSSPKLNECASDIFARYAFIDKVFTVYDSKTIEEQNININCGARSCASCGLCYFDKTIKFVSEKLK